MTRSSEAIVWHLCWGLRLLACNDFFNLTTERSEVKFKTFFEESVLFYLWKLTTQKENASLC